MDNVSTRTTRRRRRLLTTASESGKKSKPKPRVSEIEKGTLKGALPENILTLLAFDVDAIPQIIASGVRTHHFENQVLRRLAKESLRYFKKYGKAPRNHLPDLVEDRLTAKRRMEVCLYTDALNDIKALSKNIDRDFVLDRLQAFIKKQELRRTVVDFAECLQREDIPAATKCLRKGLETIDEASQEVGPLVKIRTRQELRTAKFPKVRDVVYPIMQDPSIDLLSGPFGAGKTQLGMGLANAISSSEDFLGFSIAEPYSCFYMDAELPVSVLQQRDRLIVGKGKQRGRLLSYWSAADCYPASKPNFADEAQIPSLVEACDPFDVAFLDNVSALTTGVDLNTAEAWEGILEFAMRRRHAGKTTVLIQHVGKDKSRGPRGSSRQEDFVDTSLMLEKTPCSDGNSAVKMTCRKLRNHPESDFTPTEIKFVNDGDRLRFEYQTLRESKSEMVAKEYQRRLEDGLIKKGTQAELAKAFILHKSTVSRIASKTTRKFRKENR